MRRGSAIYPALTLAALIALYAAGGFLVLPAILKSQIEARVPQWLGHPVSVGHVDFNPFTYRAGPATDGGAAGAGADAGSKGSLNWFQGAAAQDFYAEILRRLVAEQPISDAALRELATRRGQAVVEQLARAADGLEPHRISVGSHQQSEGRGEPGVTLNLQLEPI